MADIPKIVRQRLQATSEAGPHPDPDLLTAFGEQALPERERIQLLAHLSQCSHCREVLSLSAPQSEAAFIPAPAPSRSAWISWPVLRWGALAACMVVVGGAVTLYYNSERFALQRVATPAAAPATAADETLKEQIVANREPQSPAQKQPDMTRDNRLSKQLSSSRSDRDRLGMPARIEGRLSNALPAPPASAVAAPAPSQEFSDTAKLEDEREQKKDESRGAMKAGNEAVKSGGEALEVQPAVSTEASEGMLGKAKEAPGPTPKAGVAGAGGAVGGIAKFASAKAARSRSETSTALYSPRWTLSADGTLQRSVNAGKTWETIPVASNAKFRALAALGPEIWVGGARGTLYHSSDAGEHWLQVNPTAAGKPLTADIIGVEFTDTQHGKLTTQEDQTWITTDGGQTWEVK